MWQRFTELARKAIFYAQEDAQSFGASTVDTTFLLLGLIRNSGCVAAQVLERLSVPVSDLRKELETNAREERLSVAEGMTLSPSAKRAVDLAYNSARQLKNNFIGTEHLLLGVVAEGSAPSKTLKAHSVNYETLEKTVIAFQKERRCKPEETPPPPEEDSSENREEGATGIPHDIGKRVLEQLSKGGPARIFGDYGSLLLVTRQNLCVPRLMLLIAISDEDSGAAKAFAKVAGPQLKLSRVLLERRLMEGKERPTEIGMDTVLARAAEIAAEQGVALNSIHLFYAIYDLKADPYLHELIGDRSLSELIHLVNEEG